MLPSFTGQSDDTIRSSCRERLEALEHWLRRLIHDSLMPLGEYMSRTDSHGNFLVKRSIAALALERQKKEPKRYPRVIDAVLLEDAVDIVCNPNLFHQYFSRALKYAYPDGREEARTFLRRVCVPRNNLSHANAISLRQAEQVVCYSNDIIDSIKTYYREIGMQAEYDVPLILKATDSFGNQWQRPQMSKDGGGVSVDLVSEQQFHLRPGDILTVEVEVDPTYTAESYTLEWMVVPGFLRLDENGRKLSLKILPKHVTQRFQLVCSVVTNLEWHRLGHADDVLILYYKVLPPI